MTNDTKLDKEMTIQEKWMELFYTSIDKLLGSRNCLCWEELKFVNNLRRKGYNPKKVAHIIAKNY